jgi:hypothetical protein
VGTKKSLKKVKKGVDRRGGSCGINKDMGNAETMNETKKRSRQTKDLWTSR